MTEHFSFSTSAPGKSAKILHFLFRRPVLLTIVALVGLGLSLILGGVFARLEDRAIKRQFESDAGKRVQELTSALKDRFVDLKFLSAFYAGSDEVERREFHAFMGSILAEKPDVEFFAWVPRVANDQRAALEKQMHADGFADRRIYEPGADGKLQPAPDREIYYPFWFVESLKEHLQLIGFDLYAEPSVRATIEQVMTRKLPAVAQCNLPNAKGGFDKTLCLFEYAESAPATAEDKGINRQLCKGVVISAINLRALLENAVKTMLPAGVNMFFFEDSPAGKYTLLLARPSRIQSNPLPLLDAPPLSAQEIDFLTTLNVADQKWTIYCLPIDSYSQANRSWGPWTALFVGLLATTILWGYLFLLTGRAQQVESLVLRRTEDLRFSEQRFRRLIDGAGDAFFLHDSHGKILDVNRRACECLGYSRDELLNMNIMDLDVQPYKIDKEDLPWNLPEAMYPMTFEGSHRRKNGEVFPVEIRLTFLNAEGRRLFLGLARDISERKLAEAALQAEQRLLRQMLDLLENDRKLVAYEIHDGLAQLLAGLSLHLQSMQAAAEEQGPDVALGKLPKAILLIDQSVREARRLIGGLRPPILDELGVVAAISDLVNEKRWSEPARIEFQHEVNFRHLASPLEAAIFRIAQESLTNACRYSHSEKIVIDLKQSDGRVKLKIQDWGIGFDPQKNNGHHFGLRGIRERARLLGGNAEIVSAPHAGTTVSVEFPLVERSFEE